MKKLAFSMAAMAFMLSASAAEGDEDQNNTTEAAYDGEDLKPNGLYGGFGITLTNNEWRQSTIGTDLTYTDDYGATWVPLRGQEDLCGVDYTNNVTRLSPVLFFGWGCLYKNFWFAPEISVQLGPNVEVHNNRTDIVTGTRRDSESWIRCNGIQPTLALKIGYYCARWNSVVYAKFGAVYKKFTWFDSEYICDGWSLGDQINYDGNGDNARAVFCSNRRSSANWNFVFAVGVSRALSKYVTVSGEFTCTLGKKVKMIVEGAALSLNAAEGLANNNGGALNVRNNIVSDKVKQELEFHNKVSFGAGVYFQCNFYKPQSTAAR